MSRTLAVCTDECRVSTGVDARPDGKLHVFMFTICAALIVMSVVGSWLTDTSGFPSLLVAAVLLPGALVPAIFRHDRHQYDKRDAALALPWLILLAILIPFPVLLSARLGFPLRDAVFANIDHALGFSVPAIMAWTSHHRSVGALLDRSYSLLFFLLPVAVLLPTLAGRKRAAEEFLLANSIAFLLALPLFALLPAIGPWVGCHFAPNPEQAACERSIAILHSSASATTITAIGIVCFPSFHVIWAVLSAAALGSFKWLRLAATVVAVLIVMSTVTTGWHYFTDVLGALLVASISIVFARRFRRMSGFVR